ncbi:MAG: molybdopterin-binding protein [Pirellulaceae bacterium]|nr:molybdopterin-binding protein [Pirellulaceae bacterium]
MRAEIISIGDELTSGQRLDTNSRWLSAQLADLGVQTAFHTTVGDSLSDNIDAFRTAARRVDLVVCTGGLGPTADDLTREAMSEAFEKPLELRQEALAHIESLFARRRRPMPDRNRSQAMFPVGAAIIPNPHGSAPGIDMTVDGPCRFFALPGVPAEMIQMWNETVLRRLIDEMGIGGLRWFYRSLRVFGIGESDVEAKLPDLIRRDRVPRVGITVSQATINLRIACLAKTPEEAVEMARATEHEIYSALGDLVFGSQEQELDDVVHERLVERRQTLGIIEYGGDSVLAHWMASHVSHEGSSYGMKAAQWYPSIDAAARAHAYGQTGWEAEADWPARESLHRSIAKNAKASMQTDWLLMVGPYPSYADVQDAQRMPICEFTITLIGPEGYSRCEKFELGGHPDIIFARLAKAGLDDFRKHSR